MPFGYLVLGYGLWCLYFGLRGINPRSWNPGGQSEAGAPMRASTRAIYCVGGVMLTAVGIFLWHHYWGK